MNEFTELISIISTREELGHFVSRLEQAQRGLFRTGQDVENFLNEEFSARVAQKLIAYAESEKVNLADPMRASEFFTSLKGSLSNIPVVTLRIAFEPSKKQLSDFVRWFDENTSEHVVFDVVRDTGVIAGAIIEYMGRRADFSLAKKLEAFLLNDSNNVTRS